MFIFTKQAQLKAHLKSISSSKKTIGFVPTMGALHQGHLSLMQQSLLENEITIVSIFVNPTQFNNLEDLEKYPRTLEADSQKIATLDPSILLYAPSTNDIYDGNTVAQHFDFDGLENQMEGKFRPGHFNGVGTVVKRLFEILEPTKAYFGEKDFQQLQIVKKMAAKNQMNVTVIGCPIYRETNQLAMSSRNERLSAKERKEASLIFETLAITKIKFNSNSAQQITKWVKNTFEKNKTFTLEYFEIAEETTLSPCIKKNKSKKYRAFIAVFVNNIRLIDTISLN